MYLMMDGEDRGGKWVIISSQWLRCFSDDHLWQSKMRSLHHWMLLPWKSQKSRSSSDSKSSWETAALHPLRRISLSLFIDCTMGGQAEQVKGELIDQVHRKCSASKWTMTADFSNNYLYTYDLNMDRFIKEQISWSMPLPRGKYGLCVS